MELCFVFVDEILCCRPVSCLEMWSDRQTVGQNFSIEILCAMFKKTLLKMLGFYFAPAGGGQRPPEGSDYCSCKEIEQESGRVQRGRRVSRGRIPVDVRQRMYPLHLSGLPGLSLSTWLWVTVLCYLNMPISFVMSWFSDNVGSFCQVYSWIVSTYLYCQ